MPSTLKRTVLRWSVGIVIGTMLVAVTSPLFVRSYLPTPVDPVRHVWTLQPNATYRWRSEGYANTHIGPLGMPGVHTANHVAETSVAGTNGNETNLAGTMVPGFALWGDSQAEGVCVADDEKIFAIAQRLAAAQGNAVRIDPLARSGDDLRDWLAQIPRVQSQLQLDGHIFLVAELEDLAAANGPTKLNQRSELEQSITTWVPAFMIQGLRHLAFEPDGVQRRQLRFRVGPVPSAPRPLPAHPLAIADTTTNAVETADTAAAWQRVFRAIRDCTSLPIIVLYAPPVPVIMQGQVMTTDANEPILDDVLAAAREFDITWVDLRAPLIQSAFTGEWPRGFHNGQIGVGHLNQCGNEIVARSLVEAVTSLQRAH